MDILAKTKRRLNRGLEDWAGTLFHHVAREDVDACEFGKRLGDVCSPMFEPQVLDEVRSHLIARVKEVGETSGFPVPDEDLETIDKTAERLLLLHEALGDDRDGQDYPGPTTLSGMMRQWALGTGQDPDEFQRKVSQRLFPLLVQWQWRTGSYSLSNQAMWKHPAYAGEFLIGLAMVMMEETPKEKMAQSLVGALMQPHDDAALAAVMDAVKTASAVVVSHKEPLIHSHLNDNPQAKQAILSPELRALADRTEQHYKWNSGDEDTMTGLLSDIGPELGTENVDSDIRAGLESALAKAEKRSLLKNMRDAIAGSLRTDLIAMAMEWLANLGPRVAMKWEFQSAEGDGLKTRVRDWLFRRR